MLRITSITALALVPVVAMASPCLSIPPQLNAAIELHAKNARAVEYCRFRKFFSDGAVFAATYTIEGACNEDQISRSGTCGNHWERYLIVMGKDGQVNHALIGGDHNFTDSEIEIHDDLIKVKGWMQSKEKTPSVDKFFYFDGNTLVEGKP